VSSTTCGTCGSVNTIVRTNQGLLCDVCLHVPNPNRPAVMGESVRKPWPVDE
jgi:hypothetical protein